MDLGSLDQDQYLALLQRLEGSGFTKDPDSVRVGELTAIAKAAAMATEALNDAFANLFLQSVNSALDLYERTLYLVQGSTVSVDERRARLLAFRQGSWMVEARLDNAFTNYLDDTTGTTQRPTEVESRAHGASPGTGLTVSRREPAMSTKLQARDLATVLERGLPARARSAGVSQRDATWGDALEPAGIAMTPAVTVPAQTAARTAPMKFPPGSSMTRAQWVELQALLCYKSHGFSIDQTKQGRTVMCINVSLAGGATALIDGPGNGSVNWQHRFISAYGVVSSTTIADPTAKTVAEQVWLAASKAGPASSSYPHTLLGSDAAVTNSNVALDVDTSGNLRVKNNNGSGVFVTLMVRCTPTYAPGSTTDTQPWANTTQPSAAGMAELYAAQLVTQGAAGKFAGVNAGAIRRVLYSGPLVKTPTDGIPQGVTLDTSIDWRNRYVLVVPLMTLSGGAGIDNTYPVPSMDGMFSPPLFQYPRLSAPRLFFTGAGTAMGSATAQPYQLSVGSTIGFGPFWAFAETDGTLCVEMKETASLAASGAWMGLIIASDPIDGTAVSTPAPVHATQVQTHDLETVQTLGTYQQGRQGNVPRYLITDPAPRPVPTCSPLGVIGEGAFPVRPVSWMVRERLGDNLDGKYEHRQSIFGQRRRLVSLTVPNGASREIDDFNLSAQLSLGVNDQIDLRDRILWLEGRWSAADITVNAASALTDVGTAQFSLQMYTGPINRSGPGFAGFYSGGHRVTVSLSPVAGLEFEFVFSRAGTQKGLHSVGRFLNSTGATAYLNFTWEVSGKLGLCDSRGYGTP